MERPNILFIAVDDLRDYVGCLYGHPDVQTPNLDRLAKRGIVFTDAHCQAPACGPSRASLLTGTQPASTGCYGFQPMWQVPGLTDCSTLPSWLQTQGYKTLGTGKVHHGTGAESGHGPRNHEWDAYWPSIKQPAITWQGDLNRDDPRSWQVSHLCGGPAKLAEDECGDAQHAAWAAQQLLQEHDKPLFLAVGFLRPHLPFICPEQYFDLYDADSLSLPIIKDDDLQDIPDAGRFFTFNELDADIRQQGLQKKIVHSYLACVSFMDAQLGKVLDALDAGPHADNTMIMLWGDNGWHFGEKRTWKKFTLWQEATRVPLIVAGPQCAKGQRCAAPVGLIDLFPTIADCIGGQHPEQLQGHSLSPLLADPHQAWPHPCVTSFGRDNHAITTSDWKYIQYFDGSEELYDRKQDKHEWTNLALQDDMLDVLTRCRLALPQDSARNADGTTLPVYFSSDYPDLAAWKQRSQRWLETIDAQHRPWSP